MPNRFGELQKFVHYNALVAWRTRDFWVRAVLCWTIGAVLLVNDEVTNFDVRLKIRGPRPTTARIVLVDLNERDWSGFEVGNRNDLRPLKEVITFTDAYFWNANAWEKLLSQILMGAPSSIGVALFFGENIPSPKISTSALQRTFGDPRVAWGADMDNSGRMLIPLFASTYNANVGLRGLRFDDDGTARRFASSSVQVPHLAVRIATFAKPELAPWIQKHFQNATLINFRGDRKSFPVVSAKDVIEGRIAPETFENRVVIVGSLDSPLEQMQTPVGRMSRAEVIANIADNALEQRVITRWPTAIYLVLLALIMGGSIWVLVTYPQSVTLVVFFLATIIWTSGSIWAFDKFYFWIPVFSPLAQLVVTCIVFLSYQLAQNERRTWRLQQEQRYLSEIEQLKTNFVSMMSHDLKTPIAKIQAICDRLIATSPEENLANDLRTLRRSSDELHRYIQSILQVTKVEAKDFQIQKEVMDINENIERVVARVMPLAREKGLVLETRLEPMFSIEADSTLIQEVIHNLIENAIKYTPAKSGDSPGGRVTVTSQEKDDNVVVVVEDTGPGIDPEDQKDIWRKFTRGRQQTSGGTEVRGTGLGLYLVKYFIELHGGQVFLESAFGRGTRIGFSIPIADEAAESAEEETPARIATDLREQAGGEAG